MSRFLATGCAGFIGSHLTRAPLDAGNEVVGLAEAPAGRKLDLHVGRFAHGDARRTRADTTRTRRELGWAPNVPLEGGLARQRESTLAAAGTAVAA